MFQDQISASDIDEHPAPADPFCTVVEALRELRAGRMVVVTDDEDRENEGDLTVAAEFVTPETINFMATHGRGLVRLALTAERCLELGLRPMASSDEEPHGSASTVSIEAREGVSTGISAADRARTVRVAVDPRSGASDVVSPGHMFPVRSRPGGVLERGGRTEAAVDLASLAGLTPAGVLCEVMNDDGTMARVPDLQVFCAEHGLRMVSVAAITAYRRSTAQRVRTTVERNVVRVAGPGVPDAPGSFRTVARRPSRPAGDTARLRAS